jgi:hypothetical protein
MFIFELFALEDGTYRLTSTFETNYQSTQPKFPAE